MGIGLFLLLFIAGALGAAEEATVTFRGTTLTGPPELVVKAREKAPSCRALDDLRTFVNQGLDVLPSRGTGPEEEVTEEDRKRQWAEASLMTYQLWREWMGTKGRDGWGAYLADRLDQFHNHPGEVHILIALGCHHEDDATKPEGYLRQAKDHPIPSDRWWSGQGVAHILLGDHLERQGRYREAHEVVQGWVDRSGDGQSNMVHDVRRHLWLCRLEMRFRPHEDVRREFWSRFAKNPGFYELGCGTEELAFLILRAYAEDEIDLAPLDLDEAALTVESEWGSPERCRSKLESLVRVRKALVALIPFIHEVRQADAGKLVKLVGEVDLGYFDIHATMLPWVWAHSACFPESSRPWILLKRLEELDPATVIPDLTALTERPEGCKLAGMILEKIRQ